jgi:hypothetical protein
MLRGVRNASILFLVIFQPRRLIMIALWFETYASENISPLAMLGVYRRMPRAILTTASPMPHLMATVSRHVWIGLSCVLSIVRGTNMGDKRRFDCFADFIASRVSDKSVRIADVACGKAYLSWALKSRGFKHISPFELFPRRAAGGLVRRLGLQVRAFTPEIAKDFDLIVGMHPDEATDICLHGAATNGAMVFVVPCCIRPNQWTYWGARGNYKDWISHLQTRSKEYGMSLNEGTLPINGRSLVLYGGVK